MSRLSFQYKAIDNRGVSTKGHIEARSQEDAYQQILSRQMRPLQITHQHKHRKGKRVTLKDLAQFTRQIAVLMEAKIPLVDGLRSIASNEPKARLREVIEDLAKQIEDGDTVTNALRPHASLFGEVYIETIHAAESSGNMDQALNNLAAMLEQQYEMTKNIKGALMYPMCVLSALGLAVVFLMMVVVPRFATMFASRGLELPIPTQIVIGISVFIRDYWYVLIALAAVGFKLSRRAWEKPQVRVRVDQWLHRLPGIRELLVGVAISRFANVLGIALHSGVSLVDALEMAGRASGRPLLKADAQIMRDKVNTGNHLSDVIVDSTYLPPFPRRMISAGESANDLPRMCRIIAANYDREVAHLVKNVATVIEPVMIVGIAAVVLLIALAIFLPMWNMAAVIG